MRVLVLCLLPLHPVALVFAFLVEDSVQLNHFFEFGGGTECIDVEDFAGMEHDMRHEWSGDVDSANDVTLSFSSGVGVVLLERHFCVSKVNCGVGLESLQLFLACQVFALGVGTHFAQ